MFVLKCIAKLALVPVWLMLLMIWLLVHLAVGICDMFHGLGKLFFGGLAILAVALGMWQNAVLFTAFIVGTFAIVFVGAMFELVIQFARDSVFRILAT